MLVKCLYCDVENDALATSGFCDNCGKKLPTSAMARTRRAIAAGSDGEENGTRPGKRAPVAEALLTAAVVQLVAGGLFLVLGSALLLRVPTTFLATVVVWTIVPALGLGGLGFFARGQPRYAVVAALVAYVIWAGAAFAWQPEVAGAWLVVHAVMAPVLIWAGWLGLRPS